MTIRHLLFDLDDTIIDFQKAENVALPQLFAAYGLPMNQHIRASYKEIVLTLWEKLRTSEITRNELLARRFQDTFSSYGLD